MNPKAKELVEQLRGESKDANTTNVSLFHIRRQAAGFGELLVILAEEQERMAIHAEKTTQENLNLQAKVVKLTWALFWLTFLLTIVAAIQLYFIFADRP